ncbi:ricin-type beta-trefoil lectin domain protein [Streptomyces anandii]|uniref:ricin-type beta-trefoil lectin domain protein n=1 Tax=Streptomyces anandii TaxID=285454 RepID=UPI00379EFEB5
MSNSPRPPRSFGITDAQLSAELRKWTGASPAVHPVGELLDRHWEAAYAYARLCTGGPHPAGMLTTAAFTRLFGASIRQSGPTAAWRPQLLVTVRRIAAEWSADHRQEMLHPELLRAAAGDGDRIAARLLPPTDRRLLSRAFQRLPQAARALLWHAEVESEPLTVPAALLGLDEEGARIELGRARERLREECLQVHREVAPDQDCLRYFRLLDVTYRRDGVDIDPDLRGHLAGCKHCRYTADQLAQFNGDLGTALTEGVLGWGAVPYRNARVAAAEAERAQGRPAEGAGEPVPDRPEGAPAESGPHRGRREPGAASGRRRARPAGRRAAAAGGEPSGTVPRQASPTGAPSGPPPGPAAGGDSFGTTPHRARAGDEAPAPRTAGDGRTVPGARSEAPGAPAAGQAWTPRVPGAAEAFAGEGGPGPAASPGVGADALSDPFGLRAGAGAVGGGGPVGGEDFTASSSGPGSSGPGAFGAPGPASASASPVPPSAASPAPVSPGRAAADSALRAPAGSAGRGAGALPPEAPFAPDGTRGARASAEAGGKRSLRGRTEAAAAVRRGVARKAGTADGPRAAGGRSAKRAARRTARQRNLTIAVATVSGLVVLPLVLWAVVGSGDGGARRADGQPSEAPGSGAPSSGPARTGAGTPGKDTLRGRLHNVASGLCVGVTGKKVVAGAETELAKCSGAPGQQWVYEADGLLRSAAEPGLCLDSHLGYSVQLAPCVGAAKPAGKYIRYDFTLRGTLVPRFDQDLALTPAATDGAGSLVLKTRVKSDTQRWTIDPSQPDLQMEVVNWDADGGTSAHPTATPSATPGPSSTVKPSATPAPTTAAPSPVPTLSCDSDRYWCGGDGQHHWAHHRGDGQWGGGGGYGGR